MIVRTEAAGDGAAVFDVVSAAFGRPLEAQLVERLRRDGDAELSLVAEDGLRLIGHSMLSILRAPFPALALAPVSVIPPRQRQGVGAALVDAAIGRARDRGWSAIFVLGAPRYYGRFGFEVEAASGFRSPYSGAHFMVLPLTSLPTRAGDIVHAPAFAALA